MNWMGLPENMSGPESKFAILPIARESKVTWRKGCREGYKAIIEASKHLPYYHVQQGLCPQEKGIETLKLIDTEKEDSKAIEQISTNLPKKFFLALGGDHSTTIGICKGIKEEFDVIIFDAHADFFASWNQSQYNHACASRRLVEKHKVLQVGTRSADQDEWQALEQHKNTTVIPMHTYSQEAFENKISTLSKNVYVSIDCDVLDPSIISSTGTPEPAGMSYQQLIEALQIIFEQKQVIAADIVEFIPGPQHEAYTLAHLANSMFCMKSRSLN